MAGDRDLGVALLRAWAPGERRTLTGWDMLAATGVRGLRLLHETGAFSHLRLTESRPEAAGLLAENARGFPEASAERGDARAVSGAAYDYVDLDPFGSPLPFLDTAESAVRPGGVLAITATDMMVLAGVQPGVAERRYGGRPVRGRLGPEAGLRVLLGHVAVRARGRGRRVRPLLAYCRDHYVRAYLVLGERTASDPPDPVDALDPTDFAGPELGGRGPYGPMWLGPLFDPAIVGRLDAPPTPAEPVATRRMIERLREECRVDVPFYFEPNSLARSLGLASPPSLAEIMGALRTAGFGAARTHARPEGFRTDAPRPVVEREARRLGQSQNARVRA